MDQNLSAYSDPRQVPSRGPLRREVGDADPGVMASQAFALVGEVIKGPKGPIVGSGETAANKVPLALCTWQPQAIIKNQVSRPAFCSSRELLMSNPP